MSQTSMTTRRPYQRTGVSTATLVARCAALLQAHQEAEGNGLSVNELRAVYARTYGPITSRRAYDVLSALIEETGVVAVSGRSPTIRYGYSHLARPLAPDPLGDRLVAAVTVYVDTHGVCPTTHDVLTQLDADGHPRVDRHVLQRALLALTVGDTRVGTATWLHEPRLERLEVTAVSGATMIYWRVVGAETPVPRTRGETETLRQLLASAEAAIGRPVSRPELLWYMQHVLANGTEDERALCSALPTPDLDRVLSMTVQQVERKGIPAGRTNIRRFDPLALQAGPHRTRFSLTAADTVRSPVCEVEHAADVMNASAESEALAAFRRQVADETRGTRTSLGSDVLALREDAVCAIMSRLLPYTSAVIDHATSTAMASAADMLQWLKAPPVLLGTDGKPNISARLWTAVRRLDDLRGLNALLASARRGATAEAIRVLGDAAVLTPAEARTLVEQIAVPVNPLLPKERLTYLAAARRVVPTGYTDRRGYAGLDRVDALLVACRADEQPRAQTLVESAHRLLGHVLRDGPRLEALLAAHPYAEPADRRAVVVACALIGHVVPVEVAVPDPRELLDTRAYLLACALGDPAGAVQRIAKADRRAAGAAREVTDTALARAEGGLLLAVIG
jgi:hypothetical protein